MFPLQRIGNAFAAKAQFASPNDKKDADDLFGETTSQELKQFPAPKKAYFLGEYKV